MRWHRAAGVLACQFLVAALLNAQSLRSLHVSSAGIVVNDSDTPVALRGLNRSGTGSGNADATATDADYAAQNQLLSMNLVRIFVNAAWWTANVQVPIANQPYQTYIDGLIQRAERHGNYVVILKAGQFPDPPCGVDGKNCPAPNQGDLNCQANSSLCLTQDTTGNSVDAAFNFWGAFAKAHASDPAILYDTWEDMHGIDANTWDDNQNQLIAAIRTSAPQFAHFRRRHSERFRIHRRRQPSRLRLVQPGLEFPPIQLVHQYVYRAGIAEICELVASHGPAGGLRAGARPRRRYYGMGRMQRQRALSHQHHFLCALAPDGVGLLR